MQYTHTTSERTKKLRLHLSAEGEICVTTPPHTPQWLVDKFVTEHQDWIEIAQNKQKAKSKLQSDAHIFLFGTKYEVVTELHEKGKPGFSICDSQLVFRPIEATQLKPTPAQLQRFLKSTAESYLIPRTAQLADRMQLCYKRISLKQQSSRWGSCSSKGNLNFNWRLVHFQPDVIDYVIIHELAHLKHQNHAPAFWQLVAQYDSRYKIHRKALKQHYW